MIYLKKFETQAAYNAAKDGLIEPNVSLIAEGGTVEYKPISPAPSHDYVEIGGIKWATMNIGATGVTDRGLYFQWADTQGYTASQVGSGEGQKPFDIDDCKYYDYGYTKYNNIDGLTVLQSSDDAVTAAWGGNWRMPTIDEWYILAGAVNTAWTSDYQSSGVSGLVCTDKTDNSKVLFLPTTGVATYGSVSGTRQYGHYWSSSLYDDVNFGWENAYFVKFSNSDTTWGNALNRFTGRSVRGVLDE